MTTVTVYSKPACPQCTMTKKALEKNGIAFEEVALLPETHEQFASKGFRSAPIVVAGEKSWAGFQPDLINDLAA